MTKTNGASGNGAGRPDEKVRVAIVGVGNCANSFIQGVEYYKDADPAEDVPGLMHVDLGGYHVRDIEFVAAFDIDAEKVGKDLSEAIWSGQNDTFKFAEVPQHGDRGEAGHDPRRPRQVPEGEDHQGPRRDRRHRRRAEAHQGRRAGLLPAGRLRAGHQVVRRAGAEGGRRLRQLPAGLHRPRGLLEQALPRGRAADHRRRHQVAGRRDDRPPPAGAPLPRARRAGGAHLAAQRGRQHGLLQHARARAARLQEGVEDQRRHLDHGPRAPRGRRPRRALRLRRLAHRPQVGAHPPRGPLIRRRSPEHGAEARGLGLAQLGRDRDRRGADHQAGAQPRRRRRARRPLQLPDEVAAHPAARRPGAGADRGVHRRAREGQSPRGGAPSRPRPGKAEAKP